MSWRFPHTTMFSASLPPVVCKRAHVLSTWFACVKRGSTHIVVWFCFVLLRIVHPVLPVSLDYPSRQNAISDSTTKLHFRLHDKTPFQTPQQNSIPDSTPKLHSWLHHKTPLHTLRQNFTPDSTPNSIPDFMTKSHARLHCKFHSRLHAKTLLQTP